MSPVHDKKEIVIEGMHCTGCAAGIEKHLHALGVPGVSVDFTTSTARIAQNGKLSLSDIVREIQKLGYHASERKGDHTGHDHGGIEKKLVFCSVMTVPLLLHMFLPFEILHNPLLQLVFALPVFAVGVMHFGKSALGSLRARMPNMDVLVLIGSSAAFIYSLIGTVMNLGHAYQFYETSASIITFVMLGNFLEKRSVRKTTSAIEELGKIQASRARRLSSSGEPEEIAAAAVRSGDVLLVNSGDKIAADGEVTEGQALVDESMISGESEPVLKDPGSAVIGGTIVVSGNIRVTASAVGEDTVLANIIKLVRDTQSNRPAIQRIGDRVSAVFVPAVMIFAAATFIVSFFAIGLSLQTAMLNSIAVMVIACPCAMGLATPTAVMVGIGRAVKEGILMKGGGTMEKFAGVKTVVFDKTGTLTTGNFRIVKIEALNGDNSELPAVIAGLEQHSSHPIAKSLVKELSGTTPIQFSGIQEQKGLGISGKDRDGNLFMVGSFRSASALTDDESHNLYIQKNGRLVGFVDMEDEIKSNAQEVIGVLHKLGIRTAILSGDSVEKCERVAAKLNIDEVYARKLPAEKLQILEDLQKSGPAAFVGDGINDAPALARADVGVSLSNATDVAIQSAQVVLLNGNLQHLVSALAISRQTLRVIKQNLFWAFFYNVVAIPFAASGMLSPMIAALIMAFSDVIVIGNSLRLKTFDSSQAA